MRVNLLQGTHALNFQPLITFVGKAGGNQIHTASSALHHHHSPREHQAWTEQKTKSMNATTSLLVMSQQSM